MTPDEKLREVIRFSAFLIYLPAAVSLAYYFLFVYKLCLSHFLFFFCKVKLICLGPAAWTLLALRWKRRLSLQGAVLYRSLTQQ